ncbi:MAG: hypothetical protein KAR87_04460 [Candidatus Aenigmarchaeota archaeon]|nr:hypothetical protein [Candidatus Aenigmarchaeota archaeon]
MNKTILIYDTCTKNTKLIADEIAKELNCPTHTIQTIQNINNYNLIILGTPVHAFRPTKKIKQFLDTIKKPKYCAVFCTYGAPLFGKKSAENCLNYMKKKLDAPCIAEFKCPGCHHILKTHKNSPDENDLANARLFAKKILDKETLINSKSQ